MNRLLLGETNSGKTGRCEKIIEDARANGVLVGGVLSKPVFKNGEKIGNDIFNLLTDESLPLCRIKAVADFSGIQTENYVISEQAIAFGKKAIRSSLDCGLIVIDEVGVLELDGAGYMGGVKLALDSGCDTLLVMKNKHRERFLQMFPGKEFQII
jgi:nucleoside-triphosphatase